VVFACDRVRRAKLSQDLRIANDPAVNARRNTKQLVRRRAGDQREEMFVVDVFRALEVEKKPFVMLEI
jgi:hypothetical protein